MAMTDNPGGTDWGQEAASRPAGTTVRIDPKLAGCGCFGCSSLVALVGGLVLLVLLGTVLLPNWRVNHRYVAGTCRVVGTRLGSQAFQGAGPGGGMKVSYRPEVEIRYEVNGRPFQTWAYDATGVYSPDRAAQQALADSFRVGATYPFWYDPERPEKAVLVRSTPWLGYVFLIVPVGLLALGCGGIRLAWGMVVSKPVPAGTPAAEPPRLESLEGPSVPAVGLGAGIHTARFGDPVAMKTDWIALQVGGATFPARRLVEVSPDRLEFRATAGALALSLAVLAAGAGTTAVVVSNLIRGQLFGNSLLALPVALVFAAAGGYMLRTAWLPRVFDRQVGFFWIGRAVPDAAFDGTPGADSVPLGDIHAVQILRYVQRGARNRTAAYELNLVLHNAERLSVAGYAGPRQARADASAVSRFLGKPVWDASA